MLLQPIDRFCTANPSHNALTFNGQSYSYAALWEAVERLRGSLASRGIGKGDSVAIMLPNCPHFVIAHLAVLGLGAVSVPINIQHKAREIAWQIEDSEARALIAWTNLAAETEKAVFQSDSLRMRVYLGDAVPADALSLLDMIGQGERVSLNTDASENDLAAIIYTAGTGGHPRGVELTHAAFAAHARTLGQLLRLRDTDVFYGSIPFSGIAGLTLTVHLPLMAGAHMQIHSRFHPGDALRCLHDNHVSVLIANPVSYSLMTTFPSTEKYDLSQLRYAISCEAKLTDQIAREADEKLKIRIFEGYGTTESCGLVTLNLFPGLTERGSVGQPIPGIELKIVNEAGKIPDIGEAGQVAVTGPTIMHGYRNRPDKTRQVLSDGWLNTCDRGFLDEQGNLYVTGHGAEIIMKGGFPVCSREIEEVVEGLPHVREVAVVGIPDSILGEDIKVCVVLKEGASIGPGEIVEYVKERVAAYKLPKLVKLYKELPRTATGKIIRSQLKEEKP